MKTVLICPHGISMHDTTRGTHDKLALEIRAASGPTAHGHHLVKQQYHFGSPKKSCGKTDGDNRVSKNKSWKFKIQYSNIYTSFQKEQTRN